MNYRLRSISFVAACVLTSFTPSILTGQLPQSGAEAAEGPSPSGESRDEAGPTLSLEEAIRVAVESNPGHLQLRNDVRVAESSVRAAWGALLPAAQASTALGYTASGAQRFGNVVFDADPASFSSAYELGVSYRFSGATLAQVGVERAHRRATVATVVEDAANLRAAVTHQYLEVLRARDQIRQSQEERYRTSEYVRLARAILEVGDGTELDVRRAEVQHARSEISLIQARHAAETQLLMLGELLGREIDPNTRLTSTFEVFPPSLRADSLVALAVSTHPALTAARALEDANRVSALAARASYLPSLTLQLGLRGYVTAFEDVEPIVDRMLSQSNYEECLRQNRLLALIDEGPRTCQDPRDSAVRGQLRTELDARNGGFPFDYSTVPLQASLTIAIPLFSGFARNREVARMDAARDDARHQVRSAELRLKREIAAAVLNLELAFEETTLQEAVRGSTEIELRLASERFRVGLTGALEVTDVQTDLAVAERDLIVARYAFHQALARLEALIGGPIR